MAEQLSLWSLLLPSPGPQAPPRRALPPVASVTLSEAPVADKGDALAQAQAAWLAALHDVEEVTAA